MIEFDVKNKSILFSCMYSNAVVCDSSFSKAVQKAHLMFYTLVVMIKYFG